MDKIMSRIRRRKKIEKPEVITDDNIDEHREKVLKTGKKFKYPFQYSRHKVLINSVIIAAAALIAFSGVTVLMLYHQQARSGFFYNLTRIIPLPVARVNDDYVRYSDYLLRLRSSIHYMGAGGSEVDITTPEGADLIEYTKRQELTEAEKDTFASRLASELNIAVSDEEIDDFINLARRGGEVELSLESFEQAVLRDLYDQSLDEFKIFVHYNLLRSKVAKEIDIDAKTKAEEILRDVAANSPGFNDKAKVVSDDEVTRANDGRVIDVDLARQIVDPNGLITTAKRLEKGQVSEIIAGVDGYYIVRLDVKTESAISYSVIKIAFREFERRFQELKNGGNIQEYITVKSE